MTYLLDTHAFIWAVLETNRLSKKIHSLITNTNNEIYVSTISFWEISLKTRINKFSFDNIVNLVKIPHFALTRYKK